MSKQNRGNSNAEATEAASTPSEAQSSQPVETAPEVSNFTLHFKRNHPQDRASYGIPGVPGIVVIQRGMVRGTTPFASTTDLAGMPATITVSVELASPKADNKSAKAEAQAAKLAERAEKAKAKAEAQAAKLLEKQQKAQAALEAAKAKADAVAAAAAAGGDAPKM